MSFLLDTNLISELRKRERADPGVLSWFAEQSDDGLFTSCLVLGEMRLGVERLRRRDIRAAESLDLWLVQVTDGFDDRILPVDRRVAETWGRINVPDPLPPIDGLLTATALVHGLVLVTRNIKDMERSGAALLNPFSE